MKVANCWAMSNTTVVNCLMGMTLIFKKIFIEKRERGNLATAAICLFFFHYLFWNRTSEKERKKNKNRNK